MISYLGNFAEDATVYIMFNTFSSDDPSASCTITNFINTDVHIHKDDGLTQRNNAAGITVSVDFDGITGAHMVKIDTSDDTVGGFWVVGHEYFVRIEGTTIDGATINSVIGQFSIENRFNEVDVVKIEGADPTDTIRDAIVDDTTRIDASALNTLSGHDPGANLTKAGDLMGLANDAITSAKYDESTAFPVKADDAGATQIARVGADGDTLETLSDQIDAVPTAAENVNEFETQSQADPTGFHVNVKEINGTAQTANDNGADINAILTDTDELQTDWVNGGRLDLILDIIAADTTTDIPALIAALNNISTAQVNTEVDTALSDIHLDHLLAVDYDPAAKPGVATALLNELIESDVGVSRYTANALERAPIADVSALATSAALSTHDGKLDNVDGIVDNILLDTGTDGVLLAATATSAQLVGDAWDEILSGATHNIVGSAGRRVREIGAFAIESGTAQAGSPQNITLAATASAIDGTYNRNLVVLTDNTGVGQTRTIVDYDGTTKVAVIDRDWRTNPDATTAYQVTAYNTPLVVDQGVAQSGTSTTITLRTYASSSNDIYLCNVVAIIAGTGRGQARLIGAYNGTTKVATICGDNWVVTPDNTSVYVLMPYGTTCTSCIGTYALGLINTECDTALTDYDPPTRTEATTDKDAIITEVNANETKIDALNDITVADIKAGIADGTYDLEEMMRLIFSSCCAKVSGGGTTTITFRDGPDSKNRIVTTVDENGNRTATTLDGT